MVRTLIFYPMIYVLFAVCFFLRNGVWVPEDGDSCHKTGKIDRRFFLLSSLYKTCCNLVFAPNISQGHCLKYKHSSEDTCFKLKQVIITCGTKTEIYEGSTTGISQLGS